VAAAFSKHSIRYICEEIISTAAFDHTRDYALWMELLCCHQEQSRSRTLRKSTHLRVTFIDELFHLLTCLLYSIITSINFKSRGQQDNRQTIKRTCWACTCYVHWKRGIGDGGKYHRHDSTNGLLSEPASGNGTG